MSILRIRSTLTLLLVLSSASADEHHEYTNDFAVEIDGDMTVADLVAGTHNLRVVRQVCFRELRSMMFHDADWQFLAVFQRGISNFFLDFSGFSGSVM